MEERELEAIARAVAEKLGMRGAPFAIRGDERNGERGAGSGTPHGGPISDAARNVPLPSPRFPASDARPTTHDAPSAHGAPPTAQSSRIADFIDHTLLKPEATRSQIDQLCAEAREHRFAAVCVNGAWVRRCAKLLEGSGVKVAAVAGFPLGATTSEAKAWETRELVSAGAGEIDMVAAIGHILDGDWDHVEDDIRAVVAAAAGCTVKVIIEAAALPPLDIVKASAIAKEAGAGFVKTSTGFHAAGGATAEAVALMRLAVGDSVGVKAAGGVRDCATALRMIAAGANRLGTSSGVQLVQCMGKGPRPLSELLTDPDGHESACVAGRCEAY